MQLRNKVALVTGGSRGIGRAVSLDLARAGATVIVNYRRKKSAAEELAAQMDGEELSYRLVRANVEDEEGIDYLAQTASEEFGRIDILVSNAVFGAVKPAAEISRKLWDKTMNTNAAALLFLAQRVAKMPGANGGSIIAVTSLGGQRVIRDYSVVGASKAALESVVRYLAAELGPQGYRVNAIAPGVVETGALDYFPDRDTMVADAVKGTPLGRLAAPEDAAKLVRFLAGDDAAMITGQVITVDGGYSIMG